MMIQLIAVFTFLYLSVSTNNGLLTNRGKDFIFGFMQNEPGGEVFLRLFVTTNIDKDVNVTVSTPLFDPLFIKRLVVVKGQLLEVTISNELEGFSGVENKGIRVVANDDIVLYAINRRATSTGAFVVLPVAVLEQTYVVVSWHQKTSFMIIASDDNTDVKITLGRQSPYISLAGYNIGPGESITMRLNKFETLFVKSSTGDFTGTHVYGNKPVAVISGSVCANVGMGSCDHLVQQMIPVDKWGKDFITAGMPGCASTDIFRIVASLNNTTVNISGMDSQRLIESGDFYQFTLQDASFKAVSADNPTALFLYASGGCDRGSMGDPAMVLIPALQQFSSDYTFSTIILNGSDFVNSIALVIAESFMNGLRLDDYDIIATWQAIEGCTDMKYTEFGIGSGVHSVSHINSDVKFMALSSGVQSSNAYGYPLGLDFVYNDTNYSKNTNRISNDNRCTFGLGIVLCTIYIGTKRHYISLFGLRDNINYYK